MAAAEQRSTAIAERIDRDVMGGLAIADGGRVPAFASMNDVLEFAKVMAVSGIAIRNHLRNNPGACAAVVMQAQRWEMDPFTVANKSYAVNDQLAFESQLIAAVINTRAPIVGRLKTRFEGTGGNRRCIAYATFRGEGEPTVVESPPISQINPKNSPLWKTDPDQQLAYYTKRLWARRECPEVLLGVYDADELEERGPERARDVTPARPTRAEFATPAAATIEATEEEPEPWEFVDADGELAAFARAPDWAKAFLEALEDTTVAFERRQGVWETNSPMLARLRQTDEHGSTMAEDIHRAMAGAMKAEDDRKAAEAAKPEPTDAQLDAQALAEKLIEGARDQKTVPDVDDYWAGNVRLAEANLPPEMLQRVRGEVEAHRKALQKTAARRAAG